MTGSTHSQAPETKRKIPLAVVIGPTASGKTRLAVELALRFGGEVVSADSMQIYRGMDIGTAKPGPEERRGVPHHMIDIADPAQPFSVADYVRMAAAVIRQIDARGRLPILAGGTGLYVDSLLQNLQYDRSAPHDEALRQALRARAAREGGEALLRELAVFDPETAAVLPPADLGRIIRAIEVYRLSGVPMSEMKRRARQTPSPYRAVKIGLGFADRAALYARIDRRVDEMMAAGLLGEVENLLARPGVEGATAMQAIGYKELARHLAGEISLPEAVEQIKRGTRRYAKRQMTWFRREESVHWLDAGRHTPENICSQAGDVLDKSALSCYN